MDPIVQGYFAAFKESFDIQIEGEGRKKDLADSHAFEKFVNYLLLSEDDPTAFIGNASQLDTITVGEGYDLWTDGIAIRINGQIVTEDEDIQEIVSASKKIEIDFLFVQTKMKPNFELSDLTTLLKGVELFLNDAEVKQNTGVEHFRHLKEKIYKNTELLRKLSSNPNIFIYYVTTGAKPSDTIFSDIIETEKKKYIDGDMFYNNVTIELVGGKDLVNISRELENNYSIDLTTKDIIPLIVEGNEKIKKSYIFTCSAKEFLKVLKKEDGNLRRSLFNDNVRDYLGNKGSVNSEIETTIRQKPEMFLLCNNGITIVSSDFIQIKDKLVRIDNPQIVNGCQTSNSIFNLREDNNIDKVQLSVRVICTDDFNIANEIVRGTNKQNQVLDEAFECTRPFHKELETYFRFREDASRIYYERRNKQYSNDPEINKIQVANLRVITQSYVATFMRRPHKAHCHEANLLREYAEDPRVIYRDEDEKSPYYLSAYIWYKFEKVFRNNVEDICRYKAYKAFFYYIYIMSFGIYPPRNAKDLNKYCDDIIKQMDSPNFIKSIGEYISVFKQAVEEWKKKGKSHHGIKDNHDFTNLLNTIISRRYFKGKQIETLKEETPEFTGKLLNFRIKNGHWFGLIKGKKNNLYFDKRTFSGNIRDLVPGVELIYNKKSITSKDALNVRIYKH